MRWWCAATTAAWDWTWRPYAGVWVLVALGLVLYRRGVARASAPVAPADRRYFYLGLFFFWLANDWPVAALGGGYWLAAHTAQYILLTMCAAPFLVLGLRPLLGRPTAARNALANPLVATFVYVVTLGVTHVPAISDALMATQWGSFLIDMAWLAGGVALWWPVMAPDGIRRMGPLGQLGYLFVATIFPTVPSAFLVFAEYPLYRVFELAPRVYGWSAAQDQQLAGLSMKLIADPFVWVAMGVIFFRWYREENQSEPRASIAGAKANSR